MDAWTSRTQLPMPEPDRQEALELNHLPPELLLKVLSYLPTCTLLKHCRLVCHTWRALVDGKTLWLQRLAQDKSVNGRALLNLVRSCLPPSREDTPCPLGRFCALRPLGRNLIDCGLDDLRKWTLWHGRNGWVVEDWRSVPGAPSQICFVSSFSWCQKRQIVDLEEKGLWPELMDSGGVEIIVSDWRRARCSCSCRCRVYVALLDGYHNVIDYFSAVPDPTEHWNNSVYLQVTHVFSNIKRGIRFVSFEHWDQDIHYWANYYRPKVTNSCVIVQVCQS